MVLLTLDNFVSAVAAIAGVYAILKIGVQTCLAKEQHEFDTRIQVHRPHLDVVVVGAGGAGLRAAKAPSGQAASQSCFRRVSYVVAGDIAASLGNFSRFIDTHAADFTGMDPCTTE